MLVILLLVPVLIPPIVVSTTGAIITVLVIVPLSVKVPSLYFSPLIIFWRLISIIPVSWTLVSPLDVIIPESSIRAILVLSTEPLFL